MTWILQHQVCLLATCHIHVNDVISVFQKRYIWIYLVYPKLKKLHLVYTRYIFLCHMPYLSMSYPCHKFVRLSGSGPRMKFSRKLHCGSDSSSSFAYHCTAFIKHNKIYLPLPRARTPPLPPALGGDAAGAGSCAPTDPTGAGACSLAVSVGGGSASIWGFLGVQDSARALCAVTLLAPAMLSTPSAVRRMSACTYAIVLKEITGQAYHRSVISITTTWPPSLL